MKTIDKINLLNNRCKTNWEIRYHNNLVDINYPDSPITPDYEDYTSLDEALDVVIKDLLAQKEDRKECKHNWKLTPDTWGETCFYCGKQRKIKTTTSPLELPKINNNFSSMEQYNWAKQITDEVNKLYQLIKEKL